MATTTSIPSQTPITANSSSPVTSPVSLGMPWPEHLAPSHVSATVYSFPKMEPLNFVQYPANHLYLPLRKDLLHRAVIFEGDRTRQGTASTKWRREVHGSTKKLHPQKGTGRARVGDKKSPIRRGGGVAFGPKPRDFSTKLPRKIYDLAWRTALSYRYRRGELIIFNEKTNTIPESEINAPSLSSYLAKVFETNGWGHSAGRSTIILSERHENLQNAMEDVGHHGTILAIEDVDVKDLLKTGRLIIGQRALKAMLNRHSRDINGTVKGLGRRRTPAIVP